MAVCAPALASTYKFPLYGVLLVARRRNSPDAPRIKSTNLFSSSLAGESRKVFGVIMEQRLLGAKNIIVGAVVHAAKAFLYRSFGCVSPVGEKGKVANRFFRFIMTFAPPRKSPQLFPFSRRCVRLPYTRNLVLQNSIFKLFARIRKTTGSFNIQNLTTLDFLAYTDKTELRIFMHNDDCNNVCRKREYLQRQWILRCEITLRDHTHSRRG